MTLLATRGASSPIGCGVPGCSKTTRITRGYCAMHYMRLLRHGRLGPPEHLPKGRLPQPLLERFLASIVVTETCVEWRAFRNENGYGRLNVAGKQVYAHRLSYELFVGQIPEGMTIDHLCENHGCVWPQHLELVTLSANVLRRFERHPYSVCQRGHQMTPENIYTCPRGWKLCRTCRQLRRRGLV